MNGDYPSHHRITTSRSASHSLASATHEPCTSSQSQPGHGRLSVLISRHDLTLGALVDDIALCSVHRPWHTIRPRRTRRHDVHTPDRRSTKHRHKLHMEDITLVRGTTSSNTTDALDTSRSRARTTTDTRKATKGSRVDNRSMATPSPHATTTHAFSKDQCNNSSSSSRPGRTAQTTPSIDRVIPGTHRNRCGWLRKAMDSTPAKGPTSISNHQDSDSRRGRTISRGQSTSNALVNHSRHHLEVKVMVLQFRKQQQQQQYYLYRHHHPRRSRRKRKR